jgi:hypothetical protein
MNNSEILAKRHRDYSYKLFEREIKLRKEAKGLSSTPHNPRSINGIRVISFFKLKL